MAKPKPTLCPTCGNYLLPWTLTFLPGGYYLVRPCPATECDYMMSEFISRDGEGLDYWDGN